LQKRARQKLDANNDRKTGNWKFIAANYANAIESSVEHKLPGDAQNFYHRRVLGANGGATLMVYMRRLGEQ
jgi:hypothetical protein